MAMPDPSCHCNSPPKIYQHHHEPKLHHGHDNDQMYQRETKRVPSRLQPQRVAKSSPNPIIMLCCGLLALIILLGIIAFILYLVYRPSHPHFSVTSIAILSLTNTTSPFTAICTSMQLTILIKNPNSRTSINYDCLTAFLSYRNQAITYASQLPTLTQQPHSSLAVSPVVGGGVAIPVSDDVADGLMSDEVYGVVGLRLVVQGRIRFQPGPFHGRWGPLYVRCEMMIAARKGFAGQVPLLGNPSCYASP